MNSYPMAFMRFSEGGMFDAATDDAEHRIDGSNIQLFNIWFVDR